MDPRVTHLLLLANTIRDIAANLGGSVSITSTVWTRHDGAPVVSADMHIHNVVPDLGAAIEWTPADSGMRGRADVYGTPVYIHLDAEHVGLVTL
jgi:hypothetical protein